VRACKHLIAIQIDRTLDESTDIAVVQNDWSPPKVRRSHCWKSQKSTTSFIG